MIGTVIIDTLIGTVCWIGLSLLIGLTYIAALTLTWRHRDHRL